MMTETKQAVIFFVIAVLLLIGYWFYSQFAMLPRAVTTDSSASLSPADKEFEQKILSTKIVPLSASEQAIEKEVFSSNKAPLAVSPGEKLWMKKAFDK